MALESTQLAFTILFLWFVVLITMTTLARALMIINPVIRESSIKAAARVDGVRLPDKEVTEYVRKSLLYLAVAVGLSLGVVVLFGMIILLKVPSELAWAGIFLYLLVPIMVIKVINILKVFEE